MVDFFVTWGHVTGVVFELVTFGGGEDSFKGGNGSFGCDLVKTFDLWLVLVDEFFGKDRVRDV